MERECVWLLVCVAALLLLWDAVDVDVDVGVELESELKLALALEEGRGNPISG